MAGGNLTRKTTVFAALETTQGTPVGSFPAAGDAVLVFGDGAGVFTPEVALIDLQPLRDSLTPSKQIKGKQTARVALQTCLMSRNAVGAPAPFFGPLLQACGASLTGSAPTSSSAATYAPVDSAFKSISVAVYADGIKHLVVGAMGNYNLQMTAGQAPQLNFDLQGVLSAVTAAATPTATFPSDTKVIVGSETLTITPLGGSAYTPVVRSVQIASGNTVSERNDANQTVGFAGYSITARAATCNVVIECDTALAFDPINDLLATKTHAVTFNHKTGVQSEVIFTAPTAELTGVTYADDGGFRTYNLAYRLQHASAAQEWSLAFKEKQ